MKKLFVSAGLVAIGAASVHADGYGPDLTATDASKIWSLSGTMRGFYDDNYTTGSGQYKRSSWGFEFSPSFSLIMPLQQTEIGLRYTYGLYYYQDRENTGQNPIDQTQEADLWVDHAFSERLQAKVQDVFVMAQEPQLSSGTGASAYPYRAEGNNIDNTGTLTAHAELSPLFSTDVGYQNSFTDYQNHGATTASFLPPSLGGTGTGASLEGLLGNDGNTIWVNLNYQYLDNLSFLIGYSFNVINYIGNEPIASGPVLGEFYNSDSRNQYSHDVYIGTQYAISANLSLSAQVGAEFSDNYDLPSFDHQPTSQFQPTASLAATYTYLPGDYVQVGLTQSESPTYVTGSGDSVTLYEESSVVYASVNHEITPDLLASVIGHYQYSVYQGGSFDGGSQGWYSLGLNLSYTINPFLSAEIGYNYDYLDGGSATPSYHRNREYVGITATY